ncbi:MAG TPA: membrane protein insertase YidC [Chthoniobacter sp.]|jgi:YidC/Oxa1 family membrane protein insertase
MDSESKGSLDRTGIAAIAVCLALLIAWWVNNTAEMKKQAAQHQAQVQAAAEQAKAEQEAEAKKAPPAPAPTQPATPPKPAVPEKLDTLDSASASYTFTTHGGGIAKVVLKKYDAEPGALMTLNEFGTLPIGAVSDVPGQNPETPFTVSLDRESGDITFEGHDPSQLHLTKKFTVPKSDKMSKDYIVTMRLVFDNRSKSPMNVPGYFVCTGSAAPVHPNDRIDYTGFKWPGAKFVDTTWFSGSWFSKAQDTYAASQQNIPWAAVADQYFTTIVTPQVDPKKPDAAKQRGISVWAQRFPITDAQWAQTNHIANGRSTTRYGMEGALEMPGFTLAPAEKHAETFQVYAGPREWARLRLMPEGQSDVLAFADTRGIFGFIGPFVGFFSKTLLLSLNAIHRWVGSYWLAIVILTLLIKAILWPLQNKATRSAKRMQLLQPKMAELKEKYKDDPTRMNTEMMKLYKDFGINPLGGCWPAFIQMPIFFGFYNMLGKAVELRNSKFLWVKDLSQPDTIFRLPSLGYPVNILPLIMAATIIWQMKASPKAGDPSQQKMMMLMPLVFVLFCYNYASALALYLIVNNLVSVVQLYVTKNQPLPKLEKRPPPKRK